MATMHVPTANPQRGEVVVMLGGRPCRLVLTLGALAGLEPRLGEGGLGGFARRLAEGQLPVAEAVAVVMAGLEGAGEGEPPEVASLPASELPALLAAATRLLAATFEAPPDPPPQPQAGSPSRR